MLPRIMNYEATEQTITSNNESTHYLLTTAILSKHLQEQDKASDKATRTCATRFCDLLTVFNVSLTSTETVRLLPFTNCIHVATSFCL